MGSVGGTLAANALSEEVFARMNRGILLTPFHNMALMSPATSEADVDAHTDVFREAVSELAISSPDTHR